MLNCCIELNLFLSPLFWLKISPFCKDDPIEVDSVFNLWSLDGCALKLFSRGWFILFIFVGRILLVLSHKIGVPGWVQLAAFTVASVVLPFRGDQEKRLSPGAMSTEYTLMLVGAYVAPATCFYFSLSSCFGSKHAETLNEP